MGSDDSKVSSDDEPWGVLVLRIWTRDGPGVRAHLSQTTGLDGSTYSIGIADDVDQITGSVRAWLLDLIGRRNTDP